MEWQQPQRILSFLAVAKIKFFNKTEGFLQFPLNLLVNLEVCKIVHFLNASNVRCHIDNQYTPGKQRVTAAAQCEESAVKTKGN